MNATFFNSGLTLGVVLLVLPSETEEALREKNEDVLVTLLHEGANIRKIKVFVFLLVHFGIIIMDCSTTVIGQKLIHHVRTERKIMFE
jgi:hypothetical protein